MAFTLTLALVGFGAELVREKSASEELEARWALQFRIRQANTEVEAFASNLRRLITIKEGFLREMRDPAESSERSSAINNLERIDAAIRDVLSELRLLCPGCGRPSGPLDTGEP